MNNTAVNGGVLSVHRQKGAMSKQLVGGLLVIFGLVVSIWAVLPSTFTPNTDLIGQGKPVILVVYDSGDDVSANLKYGYQKISAPYEDSVEFVLVNVLSPNGIRFLATHDKATVGTALYYDAEGKQLMVLHGPKDVTALDESIKTTFGL